MVWAQLVPAGAAVDWGRVAYLLVAFATHALLGAVLVSVVLEGRPWVGAVAGLAADADFLFPAAWGFPFVHRGVTHSPAALLAVIGVGVVLRVHDDRLVAVAVAYLSHLVLDTLTPKGVLWLFPASTGAIGFDLGGHSLPVTVAIWTLCGGLYAHHRGLLDSVPVPIPGSVGAGQPAGNRQDDDGDADAG